MNFPDRLQKAKEGEVCKGKLIPISMDEDTYAFWVCTVCGRKIN